MFDHAASGNVRGQKQTTGEFGPSTDTPIDSPGEETRPVRPGGIKKTLAGIGLAVVGGAALALISHFTEGEGSRAGLPAVLALASGAFYAATGLVEVITGKRWGDLNGGLRIILLILFVPTVLIGLGILVVLCLTQ